MSYQFTTLDNGLRVASETLPHVETVSVVVNAAVGARHERPEEGGLSHLLEHMAFKGTDSRSAQDIAEQFDDTGGALNAYTSLENTVYYAKVLKEDTAFATEILADILQHSTFDAGELAREQQVILQEIAMHHDTPEDKVGDVFQELAYPGQALGRPILGQAEQVAAYQPQDLRNYMQLHYAPENLVFTAAGNIAHDAAVKLAERYFTDLPATQASTPEPARYGGGAKVVREDHEQVQIMLGYAGVPHTHPDYYPLQLASLMLGGGLSSRLFQEIREKRGLAYAVSSHVSAYKDSGIFGVYAGTGPEQTQEVLDVVRGELARFVETVSEAELQRAKNQIRASLLMARERTTAIAEWIARHLHIYGRYRSAAELLELVDAITLADITRAFTGVMETEKPVMAVLGNAPEGVV